MWTTNRWTVLAVQFTQLTVGDADPLAAGKALAGPTWLVFRLYRDDRGVIRADFAPERGELPVLTYGERDGIEQELKTAYRLCMSRLLYGTTEPDSRETVSAHVKVLRAGFALTPAQAAKRLDVRSDTLQRYENGILDLDEEMQKYITPEDSLLFRMASLYHVAYNGAWELWSPYFFIAGYVQNFSYDLIANPCQNIRHPWMGRVTMACTDEDGTPQKRERLVFNPDVRLHRPPVNPVPGQIEEHALPGSGANTSRLGRINTLLKVR